MKYILRLIGYDLGVCRYFGLFVYLFFFINEDNNMFFGILEGVDEFSIGILL